MILPPFEIQEFKFHSTKSCTSYCTVIHATPKNIYGLAFCKISWFLELSRWYFVTSKVAHMKNPKKNVKTTVTSASNHSGSKVAWFWWVGGGHTSGFVVGGGKLDFRES